jgi:hypothetical protein
MAFGFRFLPLDQASNPANTSTNIVLYNVPGSTNNLNNNIYLHQAGTAISFFVNIIGNQSNGVTASIQGVPSWTTSGVAAVGAVGAFGNLVISLPSGLNAWWNFENLGVDMTGNGFNGTLNGTTLTLDLWNRPARSFNGTSDYISGTTAPLG